MPKLITAEIASKIGAIDGDGKKIVPIKKEEPKKTDPTGLFSSIMDAINNVTSSVNNFAVGQDGATEKIISKVNEVLDKSGATTERVIEKEGVSEEVLNAIKSQTSAINSLKQIIMNQMMTESTQKKPEDFDIIVNRDNQNRAASYSVRPKRVN